MASSTEAKPAKDIITPIATFDPASLSRAWLSAPHPSNPILASCSSDKTVRIYSLKTFTLLSTISGGHKRSIRTCAWKPGLRGESVLATGSFDASVGIWRHDDEPLHHTETDYTAGLSHGSSGVTGDNDDESEGEEWRFALVLDGHDSEVKSVAWSAGGNLLATCARDKSVWIWEEVGEDDYETVAVLQEHSGDVKCVAWHPEEELLASGAYDDDVRLWKETPDDWECVALLSGHGGTVWTVAWEGASAAPELVRSPDQSDPQAAAATSAWLARRHAAGPRLASCSADGTVRIWRRVPREPQAPETTPALSIIRTGSHLEDWTCEAVLPAVHAGAVYAVAWSPRTGLLASTGDDGQVAIYAEQWSDSGAGSNSPHSSADAAAADAASTWTPGAESAPTAWRVVAVQQAAHEEYELNHVAWAARADAARRSDAEDLLVTTGDDGGVRAWAVDVDSLLLRLHGGASAENGC